MCVVGMAASRSPGRTTIRMERGARTTTSSSPAPGGTNSGRWQPFPCWESALPLWGGLRFAALRTTQPVTRSKGALPCAVSLPSPPSPWVSACSPSPPRPPSARRTMMASRRARPAGRVRPARTAPRVSTARRTGGPAASAGRSSAAESATWHRKGLPS